MGESDLNFLVAVRGRLGIMLPYAGEGLTDVDVLISVEECPYLVNRTIVPALSGITGNRDGSFGNFERMEAVLPAVSRIDACP